jgi:hypothetical protein
VIGEVKKKKRMLPGLLKAMALPTNTEVNEQRNDNAFILRPGKYT